MGWYLYCVPGYMGVWLNRHQQHLGFGNRLCHIYYYWSTNVRRGRRIQ